MHDACRIIYHTNMTNLSDFYEFKLAHLFLVEANFFWLPKSGHNGLENHLHIFFKYFYC